MKQRMSTQEELNRMVEFIKEQIIVDKTKKGDIKIDIDCIRWLLYYMEELQNIISNNLQVLDDREQVILEKSFDIYNYVWASTIGIGTLRQLQATFYEGMNRIDNCTSNEVERIELDKLRTSYLEEYIEAKSNRETLAAMLDKISSNFEYFYVNEK